jgi:uncharacterized protein YkwD
MSYLRALVARALPCVGILLVGLSGLTWSHSGTAGAAQLGDATTLGHPAYRESSGSWDFNRSERCFMRKINDKRAHLGRRRLNWDRQVGFVARRHSRKMARYSSVFHDPNMGNEITRWRRLGQNSGAGPTCRRLFRAFWRSSKHRSNILGEYRFVGVGTDRRNGRIYVQQVFESRRDPGNIYSYP